jgi:NADH:ubiquinone oxidoreductase subunit F (NADH-binding)
VTLAAEQFPRLLHAMPADGPLGLQAHESLHGPLPRPPRRGAGGSGHPLILELERAGLRGYGGGGFPTATKLAAVAAQRGHAPVVVNASEGEPLSQKDVLLMRHLPHLVIDGALVTAALLGSEAVVFVLDEGAHAAQQSVEQALAERSELAGRGAPAAHVAAVPRGYLTGQETALVSVLGGGPAKPAVTPPYPFERGLAGRPTLVSNAETYAQIGLVARYGAQWWRALGTEPAPGTRLVTVGGAVAYPGVLEVAGGTTVRRLLEASGGVTEQLQGFLLGGYAGTWVGSEAIDLRIDAPTLRDHGAGLGPGIVFALPESACVVAEVGSIARWLQCESAKQCGPCIHGLGVIADALEELCAEGDRHGAYGRIERWCGLVMRRGACGLPDGAASFVTSALHAFRPEFDDHAHYGGCDVCLGPRQLPTRPAHYVEAAT